MKIVYDTLGLNQAVNERTTDSKKKNQRLLLKTQSQEFQI